MQDGEAGSDVTATEKRVSGWDTRFSVSVNGSAAEIYVAQRPASELEWSDDTSKH